MAGIMRGSFVAVNIQGVPVEAWGELISGARELKEGLGGNEFADKSLKRDPGEEGAQIP